MKRILLGLLCLLMLAFWGCASVNQTNRFAVMPEAEVSAAPEATVSPDGTDVPVVTQPPALRLDLEPTATPPAADTPAPAETPTREPESSPGGFNG